MADLAKIYMKYHRLREAKTLMVQVMQDKGRQGSYYRLEKPGSQLSPARED